MGLLVLVGASCIMLLVAIAFRQETEQDRIEISQEQRQRRLLNQQARDEEWNLGEWTPDVAAKFKGLK